MTELSMNSDIRRIGRRVGLRDWRLEDLDRWEAWMRPNHPWQSWDAPYYDRPTEDEIAKQRVALEERLCQGDWPTPRRNLVIAQRATQELIGRVSWYWTSRETNWRTIGIDIYDDALWGQGLGTEALGLWIDYLFEAIPGMIRLDLRTWSGNQGMMCVAAKLGFIEEARFRSARIVNGTYYDSLGYGILRSEWEAMHPDGFSFPRA